MVAQINIQAQVVDISHDAPQSSDIFLVDTNVWFWQTYYQVLPSAPTLRHRIQSYTGYLKKIRTSGATPAYSGLVVAELAHIIEREEAKIYSARNNIRLPSKEYRHNYPSERAKVVLKLEEAWRDIQSIAVPASDLIINETTINAALNRFKTQALDGYDLLILESIVQAGAGDIKILTDDMDYAVVPGIQVFSSNSSLIQAAQQQNRLITR